MANWCEGTLKIRGDKESIRRFLLDICVHKKRCIQEDKREMVLTIPEDEEFYVKGTCGNFIQSHEINWNKFEPVLEISHYIGAWCIDAERLIQLSCEYQIDLKIYTFECGAMENVDFEVHKGQLIKNRFIHFDSYEEYRWECLEPDLGG